VSVSVASSEKEVENFNLEMGGGEVYDFELFRMPLHSASRSLRHTVEEGNVDNNKDEYTLMRGEDEDEELNEILGDISE